MCVHTGGCCSGVFALQLAFIWKKEIRGIMSMVAVTHCKGTFLVLFQSDLVKVEKWRYAQGHEADHHTVRELMAALHSLASAGLI